MTHINSHLKTIYLHYKIRFYVKKRNTYLPVCPFIKIPITFYHYQHIYRERFLKFTFKFVSCSINSLKKKYLVSQNETSTASKAITCGGAQDKLLNHEIFRTHCAEFSNLRLEDRTKNFSASPDQIIKHPSSASKQKLTVEG